MSKSIQGRDAFDAVVADLVARERRESLQATLGLACLATLLALASPGIAWLPVAFALCVWARHGLTVHRVAAGSFGTNRDEALEILAEARRRA